MLQFRGTGLPGSNSSLASAIMLDPVSEAIAFRRPAVIFMRK